MGAHVLVADDDPLIAKLVADALAKQGYSVEVAKDGADAFSRAKARAPDLLVTDVMMPKVDGWTLVRQLRALPELAKMPVIFLTALAAEQDKIRGFRLGADDYVIKPFKFDDLLSRVGKSLNSTAPAPAPAPMQASTAGMQGDLAQVALSALLVLVEMERKTGVLRLHAKSGQIGEIMLREGKVIDARLRGTAKPTGAPCVYQLLTWSKGRFEFEARQVGGTDQIQRSTTHLLMEGARQMDEAGMPPATTTIPPPLSSASLDDDAVREWETDESTPMFVAAQLAELVRRSGRTSTPPFGHPVAKPTHVVEPEPESDLAIPVEPSPSRSPSPRHIPWALLAGAGVALVAGLAVSLAAPGPSGGEASTQLRGDADQLGATIGRALGAAQLRAEGLAQAPMMRAGIETDAATLQDMVKTESLFRVDADEAIEVFLVRGGTPSSVLRLPATARPLPASAAQHAQLETDGDELAVVASAPIQTVGGKQGGMLAIRRRCDLSAARAALAQHARGARLAGLDHPLALAPGSATREVTLPITSDAGALSLVAGVTETPASWPGTVRTACWIVAGLLLAGAAGLWLRQR